MPIELYARQRDRASFKANLFFVLVWARVSRKITATEYELARGVLARPVRQGYEGTINLLALLEDEVAKIAIARGVVLARVTVNGESLIDWRRVREFLAEHLDTILQFVAILLTLILQPGLLNLDAIWSEVGSTVSRETTGRSP